RLDRIIYLEKGIYTVTICAKINTYFNFRTFVNANVLSTNSVASPNEFVRHTCVFEVLTDGNVTIRPYYETRLAVGDTFEVEYFKIETGSISTDWTPAPEDHISDWNESDNTQLSFIKNKPTLVNNYVESIIHTNGTTNGTVYTFKRVGLSDLTLQLTAASASFSGVVTTGAQTFEGIKMFLKSPKVPNAVNADEAVNKGQLDTVASVGDFRDYGLGSNAIATNN